MGCSVATQTGAQPVWSPDAFKSTGLIKKQYLRRALIPGDMSGDLPQEVVEELAGRPRLSKPIDEFGKIMAALGTPYARPALTRPCL
mmetsp:Transcript_10972/g.20658  ORF Transcript_10972/g.20658 Transcript_10972/m.20658 type:complete len:87 (-) Transcript_10972:358-618(-)